MRKVPEQENWDSFQRRIQSFPEQTRWLIDHAYQLPKAGHRLQTRATGQRYFEHPRQVALIVLDEFKIRDPDLIIGALLHDVGEDTAIFGNPTKTVYSEWKRQAEFLVARTFNPRVAAIFIAVGKPYIDGVEVLSKAQAEEIGLKNLADASSAAKVIKMADRLQNVRDMDAIRDPARRRRKYEETVDHYFPIFQTASGDYPEVTQYALGQMRIAMASWGVT